MKTIHWKRLGLIACSIICMASWRAFGEGVEVEVRPSSVKLSPCHLSETVLLDVRAYSELNVNITNCTLSNTDFVGASTIEQIQTLTNEPYLNVKAIHVYLHTLKDLKPHTVTLTLQGTITWIEEDSTWGSESLNKTVTIEVGDGSDCGCNESSGASGGNAKSGSVDVRISLGRMSYFEDAGFLLLKALVPSTALAQPSSLEVPYIRSNGTSRVEVIVTNGAIRQVKMPDGLVNVATESAYRYHLQFFEPEDVTGPSGGLYGTNAAAYNYWTIENPDGATHSNRLVVSETRSGSSRQWTYVFTNQGGFDKWILTDGGGLRTEAAWTENGSNKVHEVSSGGVVVQKETKTYWTANGYQRMVRLVEGDGSLKRTNTYTYDSAGNPQQVNYWDGNWEYTEWDSLRRPTLKQTPIGNSSGPNTHPYKQIEYTYDIAGSTYDLPDVNRPLARLEVIKVSAFSGGWSLQEVSRVHRSAPSVDEVEVWRSVTPGAAWNNSSNLHSWTEYYPSDADENKRYRAKAEVHEDGTATLYDYQSDTNGFLTNLVVLKGVPDIFTPTNSPTTIVLGTRTDTRVDSVGRILSVTTKAITNSGAGIILSRDTYGYSGELGRDYTLTNLAGLVHEYHYACCGLDTITDPDGIITFHEYDTLRREIATRTSLGALSVEVSNALDAVGRVLVTTRIGTNGSIITQKQSQYSVLGDIIRQTNALGGVTTITNTIVDSRQCVTNTYPDGGTQIEVYYRDGRLESLSGTAVAPVKYIYGAQQDGSIWREFKLEIKVDSTGGTNEWVKTYYDGAGQPYKTVFASSSAPHPYSQTDYNANGKVWKQADPDGVTTLHTYNALAQQEYTIVAVSNTTATISTYTNLTALLGSIKNGKDRITQTFSTNQPASGGKPDLQRADTYVWKSDGPSSSTLVSRSEISTDGLKSWSIVYPNPSTTVTSSNVTSYASGGWRTNNAVAPDGSFTVSLFRYGQLLSTTRKDSLNAQLLSTSYGYDSHHRQHTVTDARNGTTTLVFNNADLVGTNTSPTESGAAQVTKSFYDTLGRLTGTQEPDGTAKTNFYHVTGLLFKTHGSREYPVAYGYDAQGRMRYMTNWQKFDTGAGSAVTRWNYDQYRGWLKSKDYPDASTGLPPGTEGTGGPVYTYTSAGRMATRTWKRGASTTTAYNLSGDLATITYSDGTAAVTNSYNRLGLCSTIVCSGMTNTFTYNDVGQVLTDAYTSGLLSGITITNGYDSFMRRTTLYAQNSSAALLRYTYGYDNASRLQTVTSASNSATYSYLANSSFISNVVFRQDSIARMTTIRSYDTLNRLTNIQSLNGNGVNLSSHAYRYNLANLRTNATLRDESNWRYQYDSLGQVTSGKRYWSDGTNVAGQQYEYTFDDIGNRTNTAVGGDQTGASMRAASYTVNRLNQYTARDVPGYIDVLGVANSNGAVTVNGTTAYRHGEYFHHAKRVDNSTVARYTNITVISEYGFKQTNSGRIFLAKTNETFGYDPDGNLTNDGRWFLTWDGENRLKSMQSLADAPDGSKLKLEFTYDCQGRRLQKIVSTNNGSSYVAKSTNKFVYEGWNLIAELEPSLATIRTYAWGLDLSGTEQGAGGVGGLLMIYDRLTINYQPSTHFPTYDGNGNVTLLVNANDGRVSALYEHGPFGEPLRTTGAMALACPFRFSTKFTDQETGWLYYGYRYYDPITGRWPNRDPLDEDGGLNLFGFVANDPINLTDDLGLTFKVTEHKVTLATLRAVPGVGANWFGATFAAAPPTVRGTDDILEYAGNKGCQCAKVKKAKDIDIISDSYVPTDGVGTEFTRRGKRDIWEHERKRVKAMKRGYDAYLKPSQGSGSYATRCNPVCKNTPGEARGLLEKYLEDLRTAAIAAYDSYNSAQQAGISGENSNWRKPVVLPNGLVLQDGYARKYKLQRPPKFIPPSCPQ